MHKGKVLAALGMLLVSGGIYFAYESVTTFAQTPSESCIEDRYADNPDGTNSTQLTPYAPNKCHKKRVFYNYGTYNVTSGCGNAPWCNWRVRCPAGSTIMTHSRPHYSFSPNIDGLYDGPSHSFCVDASGNEVEPLPGESDARPDHTHSSSQHRVSLAKVQVVDTAQEYFYTYYPQYINMTSSWVACPSGSHGPYPQDGTNPNLEYNFPNHYHCKNQAPSATDPNPEGLPVTLVVPPSSDILGSSFGTVAYATDLKDQFVDKNSAYTNPFGTVRCASTTSDKVYFSSTGNCPSASQFPPRAIYTFDFTVMTSAGSVEIKPGARAVTRMKLKNTGNADTTYSINCSFLPNYPSEIKGHNPEASLSSSNNASLMLTPLSERDLSISIDVSTVTYTAGLVMPLTCYAAVPSQTNVSQKKINDTISFTTPVTPPPPPPTVGVGTVTVTQLFPGQYNNVKFSITVTEPDGIKDFSVKTASGAYLYGGSPGAAGNVGSCTGTTPMKSVSSGTVDILPADFPLKATLTDCYVGSTAYTLSIPDPRVVAPPPPPPPSVPPGSCAVGAKCAKGSWCNNGQSCHYPDGQITCVAWSTTMPVASPLAIPTAPLSATSTMCPAGTSKCSPDDKFCLTTGQYGGSTSWCNDSMKCYQKDKDTNAGNDIYCTAYTASSAASCPAGYTVCSPNDLNCKVKGDTWTDSNANYYCMNTQKCNLAAGGGSCVGWGEACPAGSKYCPANGSQQCIEPGEYKTLSSTVGGSYWCGGSSGFIFYSPTQAYCATRPGAPSGTNAMWSGAEIKAALDKLGSGWKLCAPQMQFATMMTLNPPGKCLEPGQTGISSDWCVWYTPGDSMAYPYTPPTATRTCPSLDGTKPTPPPPPPPPPPPGEPPICLQVTTLAYEPATGDCRKFPNSCIPAGWKQVEVCPKIITPPPPPPDIKECGAGEMPSPKTNCTLPRYRWNIAEKKFEKCDLATTSQSYGIWNPDNTKKRQQYTNCESMHVDIEKEWKTERFLVHPPEIDGEWYMPPWDAASKMFKYNPKTDQIDECDIKESFIITAVRPGEYVPQCMPVPDKDKSWMSKKLRADYKLHQLYNKWRLDPHEPFPPEIPEPPKPDIPPAQCKQYLAGVRQSTSSHKVFWKDVRRQLDQVGSDYPDTEKLEVLLKEAKDLILGVDNVLRAGKCGSGVLSELQDKLKKLTTELFPEISSYLVNLGNFAAYAQCRISLQDQLKQVQGLSNKRLSADKKKIATELADAIKTKLKELSENSAEFDYDVNYECTLFSGYVHERMAPLLLQSDAEINRIVEEVIAEKLAPVIDQLTIHLKERGKKLDTLLVQVAQLHKAVEEVSKSAVQISEKIAVSYTALSRIEEKFAQQKAQIQNAKDRLIPLVEQAINVMRTARCIRTSDQEKLVQEFGTVATVNWLGDHAAQLEKRLNLFIASCEAKDVSRDEIRTFVTSVEAAVNSNQEESHKEGLTPFKDVPTHEWYYGAMITASKNGTLTQGRPAENVLRQDAVLMVLRASGMTDADLIGDCKLPASSSIINASPYAFCALRKAIDKGLVVRGDVALPVSRGEVAGWITQLIKLPKQATSETIVGYKDLKGVVPEWIKAISTLIANEVMVGNVTAEGKTWNPHDSLTRAALAVVLEKLAQHK